MMRGFVSGAVRAALGLTVGAGLMWLSLRHASWADVAGRMATAEFRLIALAVGCYAAAMLFRVLRWRVLLAGAGVAASVSAVGEILVIGYAANNVLPARLGEFVRAGYARRRLGVSGSTVLGTIVIERLLDGVLVVAMLALAIGAAGLGWESGGGDAARNRGAIDLVALLGAAMMLAGIIASLTVIRLAPELNWLPARVAERLASLAGGLRGFDGDARLGSIALTLPIWMLEAAALWSLIWSLGTALPAPNAVMLICVASLATLLPSAPGYVGSYQFAFALCFERFGLRPAIGIAGASLAQLFLFGSVSVAAAFLLVLAALRRRGPRVINSRA